MLISPEYKALNEALHKQEKNFGAKGFKRAEQVYEKFLNNYGVKDALDYGCGKGTLAVALKRFYGINIDCYDPCVEGFNLKPTRTYTGVICNDVLEHIEPELLCGVMDDIYSMGSHLFFFNIALCKSNKTLPDGRNAHLIIKDSNWWHMELATHGFVILEVLEDERHAKTPDLVFYTVICSKDKK